MSSNKTSERGAGPSLREIAKEAKVSLSTVSLVLNQKPKVSPQMRQKVAETLRRMGYPLQAATAAGPVRQPRIGIVYSRRIVEDGAITRLGRDWIDSMRHALEGAWARITLFAGTTRIQEDLLFRSMVESGEIEGVILVGALPEDGYMDFVEESGLPLVLMNRYPPAGQAISGIVVDNHNAGRQSVDALIEKGHRRIALFAGRRDLDADRDILTGMEQSLRKHRLEPTCIEEIGRLQQQQGDLTPADIDAICRRVLDSGATAVCAWWDTIAARCINRWLKMGVRVPEDLSVIGYDDLDPPLDNGRHLSSVFFDRHRMGHSAAELLLALLEQGDFISNQVVLVKTKVIERDTIAPPKEDA